MTTRWADNDSYGHVNNVVYYGWFDTAVNAWLVETGLLDVAAGDPIGLVWRRAAVTRGRSPFPGRSRWGWR
jgi:acyl-CoA thioester hydrolase